MRRRLTVIATVAVLAPGLAACDGSPTEPAPEAVATMTVDASRGWAFVRLGTAAQQVTISSPSTSSDWDIAFNATSVMVKTVSYRAPFLNLNARIAHTLTGGLQLSAGVNNMLNRQPERWPGFAGRQFFAGVQWRTGSASTDTHQP